MEVAFQVGGVVVLTRLITPALLLVSGMAHAACTPEQEHPMGKPENFNINEHLTKFSKAGAAASKLPLGGLSVRSSLMASMFAPGRKYDLKANPNYMSSQEFGNWFYGAAASQIGFSQQEALTAGAIVQQWQNYNRANHTDYGDISMMASNIYHALKTGKGDNADDTAPIIGGHSYSANVFENDLNSDSNADSCAPEEPTVDTSNDSSGFSVGGSGYGGGWGGGLFLGAGSCIGNCGGTGSSTITDLPDLPQQGESGSD